MAKGSSEKNAEIDKQATKGKVEQSPETTLACFQDPLNRRMNRRRYFKRFPHGPSGVSTWFELSIDNLPLSVWMYAKLQEMNIGRRRGFKPDAHSLTCVLAGADLGFQERGGCKKLSVEL